MPVGLNERFCYEIRKAVGFHKNKGTFHHAEAGRDAHL